MNTVYITGCCKEKSDKPGLMPALDRYNDGHGSGRIRLVYEEAQKDKAEFRILSGEHCLLRADEGIEYYDHLLKPEEVDGLIARVADQLKKLAAPRAVYFTGTTSGEDGKYRQPYLNLIIAACFVSKLEVAIKDWEPLRGD